MRVVFRLLGVLFVLGLLAVSTPIVSPVQALSTDIRNVPDNMLSGAQQVLVILIDSPSQPHQQSKEHYSTVFFGGSQNVADYYKEVSYGKFRLSGTVLDWITIEETSEKERLKKAIHLVDQTIDFKSYDKNKDGEVDYIIFIDTEREEGGSVSHFSLDPTLSNGIPVDNVKIDWYAYVSPDNYPLFSAVLYHELGHLLGLPDLYHYTSGDVQKWGLMGDGFVHLCAYSKLLLGWTIPITLEQEGDVIIKAAKDWPYAYKITTKDPKQYFLLEYREQIGYDSNLPASGLLIYHIDENMKYGTRDQKFYPQIHYRVNIERPDGNSWETTLTGDVFPGSTNTTSFTDDTKPSANLYDGSRSGIKITEISPGSSRWAGTTFYNRGRPLKYEGHEMSFHFYREGEKPAKNITVWPGDTNNDKIVNVKDVLPIGTYSSYHGPARYNYSGIYGNSPWYAEILRVFRWFNANFWKTQSVPVWNDSVATYADANGDGWVNESDMDTIKFNWNYNQSPVTASPYRDIPLVSKLGNDLSSDLVMAGRILEGLDITPENDEMRAMLLKFIDSAGSDQNLVKLPDNQSLLQNPQEKFQLQLAQNYPNPMNPETWIPFSLADDSDVTVKIYNLSGSLVRTLDLGRRPAGDYSDKNMAAYWDGKDENGAEVASGTYLYQLQAGPATQTRKMIVLK